MFLDPFRRVVAKIGADERQLPLGQGRRVVAMALFKSIQRGENRRLRPWRRHRTGRLR
jgi:hypothetical protein